MYLNWGCRTNRPFRTNPGFPPTANSGKLVRVKSTQIISGGFKSQHLKRTSPPRLGKESSSTGDLTTHAPNDGVQISAASTSRSKPKGQSFVAKALLIGMTATALAGCFGGGPAPAAVSQQMTEPAVMEQVQPANPFELMRLKDGSIAFDAELGQSESHVDASSARVSADKSEIAVRTNESQTLCEQATALGGTCLEDGTVQLNSPNGPIWIETLARDGEAVHRIESRPVEGSFTVGVSLNKLPGGTEVFSNNGSGLLGHDGQMNSYPNIQLGN